MISRNAGGHRGPNAGRFWRSTFHTPLGWMCLVGDGRTVARLVFGHRTSVAAVRGLGEPWRSRSVEGDGECGSDLRERLERYALGKPAAFDDVVVELGDATDFARRVWLACRAIPYGETRSYGQVAVAASSPRAARAVGNCMAANRIPLIIPCHRVVASGGGIGGFSAPGADRMKRRLLDMEQSSRQ